jgi:hypothetical protein
MRYYKNAALNEDVEKRNCFSIFELFLNIQSIYEDACCNRMLRSLLVNDLHGNGSRAESTDDDEDSSFDCSMTSKTMRRSCKTPQYSIEILPSKIGDSMSPCISEHRSSSMTEKSPSPPQRTHGSAILTAKEAGTDSLGILASSANQSSTNYDSCRNFQDTSDQRQQIHGIMKDIIHPSQKENEWICQQNITKNASSRRRTESIVFDSDRNH